MNELINITYNNDTPAVSARELHDFLGVETPYHKWFPRMCEYGFTENKDFSVTDIFVHNSAGGPQSMKDAALTIPMAKELCMLQRNDRGKEARQYFIKVEEAWNSPERLMARALIAANKSVDSLKGEVKMLREENEAARPKVLFADSVAASKQSILVGDMAKLLKQNGVDIGPNRLFEWMRKNNYLIRRRGTDYNMPTQRSMELKLFEIKETVVSHADGHTSINKTPKITGKGQQYFINKFLGDKKQ